MSVSVALSPQVDELHYVWDARPALFPDLRFTSQSSTAVTHCLLIATNFSDQLRMKARVELVCPGDLTQALPRQETREACDLTHSATQTDKISSASGPLTRLSRQLNLVPNYEISVKI